MKRCRIIFSGSGGQGIITAARLLAEAAAVHEGLNAVQSQIYGPEARGGASRSDVIISDEDILFPKVTQPNIVVSLTQEAYNNFSSLIRPGGLLLTDRHFVKQEKRVDARQIELDVYAEVMAKIGRPIVCNVCMLGALICLIPLVKPVSLVSVIESRVPPDLLAANKQALTLGMTLANTFKKEQGIVSIQLW
jgi:2-oxoglutarate ferredoxin oxidoreductase subunit gamma